MTIWKDKHILTNVKQHLIPDDTGWYNDNDKIYRKTNYIFIVEKTLKIL